MAFFQTIALGLSSSANYKIRDNSLIGKLRGFQLTSLSSTSFIIGVGFLKSVYSAKVIFSPILTSVTPNRAANSGFINLIELAGANFQTGATVKLSKNGQTDITATNLAVVSLNKITCAFDLTETAPGIWDLYVTNPDGKSGSLPQAFTIIAAAPTISTITPSRGLNQEIIKITNLSGSNFRTGAAVKLTKTGENDILADNLLVESSTKITCQFDLREKAIGGWDVNLVNDDGQSSLLLQGFVIEAPLTSIMGAVQSTANPFNPSSGPTKIKYTLSKDTEIIVYIYNLRGERVWEQVFPIGTEGGKTGVNEIVWNGLTSFNTSASFGVYIVTVTAKIDGAIKTLGTTKIAVVK